MLTRGLADGANDEHAARLSAAIRRHGGPGERIGVPFGTDAPHFAATGCPTVVFGPGDIAQAHTADEWIDLDQLRTACRFRGGIRPAAPGCDHRSSGPDAWLSAAGPVPAGGRAAPLPDAAVRAAARAGART